MQKLILFFLFTVSCFLSVSIADDSKPKDFYKDDYAVSPLDKEISVLPPKNTKNNRKKSGNSGLLNRNNTKAGANTSVLDDFEAQPIISVGAIVNAFEEEHFAKQLEELVKILESRDLSAGKFFMMHLNGPIPDKSLFAKLLVYGAMPQTVYDLPEKYSAVESSPTWIIRTEKGEYLLEGIERLSRFITADGGFVEEPIAASGLEVRPTATMPPKPQGF